MTDVISLLLKLSQPVVSVVFAAEGCVQPDSDFDADLATPRRERMSVGVECPGHLLQNSMKTDEESQCRSLMARFGSPSEEELI